MKFKKEKLYIFFGLLIVSMLNPSCKHTHQDGHKMYLDYIKSHISHK